MAVDGDAVADLSLSCISERIKGVLGSLAWLLLDDEDACHTICNGTSITCSGDCHAASNEHLARDMQRAPGMQQVRSAQRPRCSCLTTRCPLRF